MTSRHYSRSVKEKLPKKEKKSRKSKDEKRRDLDDDESSGSDMDLEKDLYPLGYYLNDRSEMISEVFSIIKGTKLRAMLTSTLKDIGLEELKRLCLIQLEGMSKKRIRCVLKGEPMDESSCTEDDEDEDDPNAQVGDLYRMASKKSNKDEDEDEDDSDEDENGLPPGKGRKMADSEDGSESDDVDENGAFKKVSKRKFEAEGGTENRAKKPKIGIDITGKKKKAAKARRPGEAETSTPADELTKAKDAEEKPQDDEAKDEGQKGQSMMELLELEMRARAIKALLNKGPVEEPAAAAAAAPAEAADKGEKPKINTARRPGEAETSEKMEADEEEEVEDEEDEDEDNRILSKDELIRLRKAREVLGLSEAKKREEEEEVAQKQAEIQARLDEHLKAKSYGAAAIAELEEAKRMAKKRKKEEEREEFLRWKESKRRQEEGWKEEEEERQLMQEEAQEKDTEEKLKQNRMAMKDEEQQRQDELDEWKKTGLKKKKIEREEVEEGAEGGGDGATRRYRRKARPDEGEISDEDGHQSGRSGSRSGTPSLSDSEEEQIEQARRDREKKFKVIREKHKVRKPAEQISDGEVDSEGEQIEAEDKKGGEVPSGPVPTVKELQSLKVPELKEKLEANGLDRSGRKSELIDRLRQYYLAKNKPSTLLEEEIDEETLPKLPLLDDDELRAKSKANKKADSEKNRKKGKHIKDDSDNEDLFSSGEGDDSDGAAAQQEAAADEPQGQRPDEASLVAPEAVDVDKMWEKRFEEHRGGGEQRGHDDDGDGFEWRGEDEREEQERKDKMAKQREERLRRMQAFQQATQARGAQEEEEEEEDEEEDIDGDEMAVGNIEDQEAARVKAAAEAEAERMVEEAERAKEDLRQQRRGNKAAPTKEQVDYDQNMENVTWADRWAENKKVKHVVQHSNLLSKVRANLKAKKEEAGGGGGGGGGAAKSTPSAETRSSKSTPSKEATPEPYRATPANVPAAEEWEETGAYVPSQIYSATNKASRKAMAAITKPKEDQAKTKAKEKNEEPETVAKAEATAAAAAVELPNIGSMEQYAKIMGKTVEEVAVEANIKAIEEHVSGDEEDDDESEEEGDELWGAILGGE